MAEAPLRYGRFGFYTVSMGLIKHQTSGRAVTLAARSLVGRAKLCAVCLTSPRASGEHAVLFWDGTKWTVRDLGSTNGTFVKGDRIAVGKRVTVEQGATMAFGDETDCWTLEECGAPNARALSETTGELREAEDGLLALPDMSDPRATLMLNVDGRWVIETDGEKRLVLDQERIDAAGPWILCVPSGGPDDSVPTTHTSENRSKLIGSGVLRFEVSQDQKHIALALVYKDEQLSLGARAYHEVLLQLARARLRDKAKGAPAAEQGWRDIDDVLTRLQLDLQHFNVNVFRARRHLAKAGVADVEVLIERRPIARQIRLGTDAVEIVTA